MRTRLVWRRTRTNMIWLTQYYKFLTYTWIGNTWNNFPFRWFNLRVQDSSFRRQSCHIFSCGHYQAASYKLSACTSNQTWYSCESTARLVRNGKHIWNMNNKLSGHRSIIYAVCWTMWAARNTKIELMISI